MTPPSPTLDANEFTLDPEPVESVEPIDLPPLPEPRDHRWHCAHCGGLALLDEDDLCRHCWNESVLTFSEVAARALTGERAMIRPRWRIG